ncbi:hypothetical protein BaRGS_00015146 [Batillaria attramentaria]|uniref:Pheromone n=1 Tax=Batillaria attramentaria TaxID=370345 RepID=A0ABD0L2C3_9CAEN
MAHHLFSAAATNSAIVTESYWVPAFAREAVTEAAGHMCSDVYTYDIAVSADYLEDDQSGAERMHGSANQHSTVCIECVLC